MQQPDTRGIGDNRPPDDIELLSAELASRHDDLVRSASALLETARSLGETIEDDRELQGFRNVIVAMRSDVARAEAKRVEVKNPYLRAERAVDDFFNRIKERLGKGMNVLQRRVNTYQERKRNAEQERLRLESEQRAREAREAREREEKARREAEEKRLVAERARKEETRAAKGASASVAEQEAAAAAAAASTAADIAEAARIDTLRPSADLVRERLEDGGMVTGQDVGVAKIVDASKLDAVALWPFVHIKAKQVALNGWAKANGHSKQMEGAEIYFEFKAPVR